MDNRVAVILTNYNMPERADALGDFLAANVKHPYDFICVDNGSDIMPPSKYTNVQLSQNRQTTGGWLAGLSMYADAIGENYFAYVFAITSCEFPAGQTGDPIAALVDVLLKDENAVGVHPALTADSTTAWNHMKTRGGDNRQTWMIDNIFSMYRADWFNSIGRFDPALTYGWGIDLETCYLARKQGRTLWIDESFHAKKVTDIGYSMDRMNMSEQDRQRLATENMNTVMGAKYGADWYNLMTKEQINDTLR